MAKSKIKVIELAKKVKTKMVVYKSKDETYVMHKSQEENFRKIVLTSKEIESSFERFSFGKKNITVLNTESGRPGIFEVKEKVVIGPAKEKNPKKDEEIQVKSADIVTLGKQKKNK